MPHHTLLCFAALTSLPRVGTTLCIAHCKVSTKLTGLDLLQINKVADAEQQWVYIEASSERGTANERLMVHDAVSWCGDYVRGWRW